MKSCILWFRKDLRLSDHPALVHAIANDYTIIPLYIYEDGKNWPMGGASKWWLHHALADLHDQLAKHGAKLHVLNGHEETEQSLLEFAEQNKVDAVFWSRRYEAEGIACDTAIKKSLSSQGIVGESFSANLINEPFKIKNLSGLPYRVFTPYWKKCREIPLRELAEVPLEHAVWSNVESVVSLESLELLPEIKWDTGFYKNWDPRRKGAEEAVAQLVNERAVNYDKCRDILAESGTSRLGPYLAFGQISPIEIIHALAGTQSEAYVRQLYWRDFSYHLLYHFPHTERQSLRDEWELFPWQQDEDLIQKWQKGATGYPVVDAAMRQLWTTGWMHNRARMIVASVLVKHFQQDWMIGAQWFWDTLVDADLANNTMGWQWSAGCGADAAPYFRVFNPVTQGQKFDPDGAYVRKYIPELSGVSNKYIHCPWEAPREVLEQAGVTLGKEYPKPLLLPAEGREKALNAYQTFKEKVADRK